MKINDSIVTDKNVGVNKFNDFPTLLHQKLTLK